MLLRSGGGVTAVLAGCEAGVGGSGEDPKTGVPEGGVSIAVVGAWVGL